MNKILIIFFYLFNLIYCENENDELKAVVVLYRHGDKTPTTSFPYDPYFNISYWPMGFGELTNKGKMRQYVLGKWFRNRYDSFLSKVYNPKEIYVLSSDVDRTLMSAQTNLAALYPPGQNQVWKKNLPWQPIPVHSIPVKQDNILRMRRRCDRFKKLMKEITKDEFYQNLRDKYKDIYDFIEEKTGWKIDDLYYFAIVTSSISIYLEYNKNFLPPWYEDLDKNALEELAGLHYAKPGFNTQLKRLSTGPFFDYLFSYLDKVANGNESFPKMLMLSGHETTVGAVLAGMGVSDYKPPKFACALMWEIRYSPSKNQYVVDLFYKKNEIDVDHLKMPGCNLSCGYNDFKRILEPVTVNVNVWEKECENKIN